MLSGYMNELVAQFDEKQNALIAAIGGNLKEILTNMKKTKGWSE